MPATVAPQFRWLNHYYHSPPTNLPPDTFADIRKTKALNLAGFPADVDLEKKKVEQEARASNWLVKLAGLQSLKRDMEFGHRPSWLGKPLDRWLREKEKSQKRKTSLSELVEPTKERFRAMSSAWPASMIDMMAIQAEEESQVRDCAQMWSRPPQAAVTSGVRIIEGVTPS